MRSHSIVLSFFLMLAVACSPASKADKPTAASGTTDNNPDNPSTPNATTDQGGTNPTNTPSTDSDGGSKPPSNQAECIAVCEGQYPKAAVKNKSLDSTCMLGVCSNVCNDLVAGKNFPPDVDADAGVVCDTVKANSFPISTPSAQCSTCLANTPTCCTQWIAIFSSADGQALNGCAVNCFSNFSH